MATPVPAHPTWAPGALPSIATTQAAAARPGDGAPPPLRSRRQVPLLHVFLAKKINPAIFVSFYHVELVTSAELGCMHVIVSYLWCYIFIGFGTNACMVGRLNGLGHKFAG